MSEEIMRFLPFLVPLILIQLGLTIASLVSAIRSNSFRTGSRVLWIVLSFVAIIGPILYFTIGSDRSS